MSESQAPEAVPPPEPAAGPPPSPEEKPRNSKVSFPVAAAAAACIFLSAVVLQNLYEHAWSLLEEARFSGGVLPLVLLSGVAAAVAVVVAVIVLRRLRRLLLSVRMTVALLVAVALFCAAASAFEPEGLAGPASAAGARNDERALRALGGGGGKKSARKSLAEGCMLLARAGGLTDLPRSWGLLALLALIGLSSAAGLVWSRPVGVREFGFLAAHGGVLLILGGAAVGCIFGYSQELRGGVGGKPLDVPAGAGTEAAFSLNVRGIEVKELAPEYQVWAQPAAGDPQRLSLDGTRPGESVRWRDWEVGIDKFRPDAVAERYVADAGGRSANPAVRLELSGRGAGREVVLYAYSVTWDVLPGLGIELRYHRHPSAEAAAGRCRGEREGFPENLVVVNDKGKTLDQVQLPFGRAKVGSTVLLGRMGVRLRVLEWFSGSRPAPGGGRMPAAPAEGVPAAMKVLPVPGAEPPPGQAPPPAFWIVAGPRAALPVGKAPLELKDLLFVYNPRRWQPRSARVVEGPEGSFQLAELEDGRVVATRPISLGETLELRGGLRLRLAEFIRGARVAYRPGEAGSGRTRPACRLAVGRGAVRESFWFFPGVSRRYETMGARFWIRPVGRGWGRGAVTVDIGQGDSTVQAVLEPGRPLVRGGYRVYLTSVHPTGQIEGRQLGVVSFVVRRTPGRWAVFLGMALVALGAPWLLWSRFRQVPDTVG